MRPVFLVALVIIAAAALWWRFPYALDGEDNRLHLLYSVLLLSLMAVGGGALRRMNNTKFVKDAAIWVGIFLLVVLAYSFRDTPMLRRIQGEMLPQQVYTHGDGSMEIRASEGGHFFIEARVNEQPVRFMVDTGATDIALSPADAKRVGLHPETLTYDRSYGTANGYGSGAKVILASMEIGKLRLGNVEASVNKEAMDSSLLGMSFLKRLRSFRVEGNTLILIP